MIEKTPGGATAADTLRITEPGLTSPGGPMQDLQPGILFANRYRIEQIIGRGGMGIVYRATDTQLDEVVAIKTLPGDVMQRSPEDLERFKREIRLARKITHRNVLRTYDYGEAESLYYLALEWAPGEPLATFLTAAGRGLRFGQEYFLVACSLSDILHRFRKGNAHLRELP